MRRPRPLLLLSMTSVLVAATAVGAVAAPPARSALCHAVPGDPGHVVLQLPAAAVAQHLAQHEDDRLVGVDVDENCEPLAVPTAALARAWSVDASGADVLIAQLEDADGNGAPSVGDVVRTDAYPLDLTGSAYGTFSVQEHVVDRVVYVSPTMVRVASGDGQFEWNTDDGTGAELYTEQRGWATTLIGDGRSDRKPFDLVFLSTGSPSAPAADTFLGDVSAADDDVVNVQLNVG